MSMLDQRKSREIRAKLDGFRAEIGAWRAMAERGEPLEKHHTQLRRIATVIESAVKAVEGEYAGAIARGAILSEAQAIETRILSLHRVWEFFRSRLALRLVPHTRPFLRTADALAWAVVGPLLTARVEDADFTRSRRGEPPLVHLATPLTGSVANTPFALGRDFDIAEALHEFGDAHERTIPAAYRAAISAVPVPMIGVPWYQLAHPTDLALVAHEAGHIAEFDLGLAPALDAAVESAIVAAAIAPARAACWRAWREEVFADVVAAAALGPGYAAALGDFLAAPAASIIAEVPAADHPYPPTTLRVALAAHACTPATAPETDARVPVARSIRASWEAAHPAGYDAAFDTDAAAMATALLDAPMTVLAGSTIRSAIGLSAAQAGTLEDVASRIEKGYVLPPQDVRLLVGGAAIALTRNELAFQQPARITAFLAAAERSIAAGVLSAAAPPLTESELAAADAKAGAQLFRMLSP